MRCGSTYGPISVAPPSPLFVHQTGALLPARITQLADPVAIPSSRRLAWLASGTDGAPLGSAFLRLFTKEGQTHLAELDIAVHLAERRQGVGTALLDAAVDTARGERRRAVIAQAGH